MTNQEIALKWLASGTWKQDVKTTRALGIIVSTLRDYGVIKAELDVVKSDYESINGAANVLHNANESLHAEVKRLKAERDAAVEDLKFACGSQPSASSDESICDICKHKNTDGSCNKMCFMNSLGAINRWEWRGVVEE